MARFARPEEIDFASLPFHNPKEQVIADLRLNGAAVADIGAGSGSYSRLMAAQGAHVLAVEPNAAVLAKLKTDGHRITPIRGGAESVRLEPGSLDIVTFFHSLHHIPLEVLKDGLRNAAAALKPEGKLYIVEPVALGPAYRVSQPIDDEAAVRLSALETLALWQKSSRFKSVTETVFRYQQFYADFNAYKSALLQVDGRRAAAFEANGEKSRELFESYGEQTPRGWMFDAVMRTIVIR